MRSGRKAQRDDRGFTIVEMTVVLSLIGVSLAVSWMLMQAAANIADQAQATSVASDEGRQALDRITRDLRQAQEATESMGAVGVIQPRQMTVYVDDGHDGRLDRVTYFVSGNSLMRKETSATTTFPPYTFRTPESSPATLVANLQPTWTGPIFEYWQNTEPPVAATYPDQVSSVSVQLLITAACGRKTVVVNSQTWVKIRSVLNSIN